MTNEPSTAEECWRGNRSAGRPVLGSPTQQIHHLELETASDLDDEMAGWLLKAYERAG